MRYVFFFLFLIPSLCVANSLDAVAIGRNYNVMAWLEHKQIKKVDVFLLGFQSATETKVEIVIPQTEYAQKLKELKALLAATREKEIVSSRALCEESVKVQTDGKNSVLCLDLLSHQDKRKLTRWVEAQRDFIIAD